MEFIYVNMASAERCGFCGKLTQKSLLFAGKASRLCTECLTHLTKLLTVFDKRPATERRDVLHCDYWDKHLQSYCAERGLWLLYHEGYYSHDRYALSCRRHLESLSKDYEDDAERVIYVDEPWNTPPITDIAVSQLRLAPTDSDSTELYRAVYVTRIGGGLARITYMDAHLWPKPVEGEHAVWVPVEDVAARWPVIRKL